jgi:hypothetical protein
MFPGFLRQFFQSPRALRSSRTRAPTSS